MPNPTEEQILARAYELWQQAGEPEGRDEEFYHQAEQELRKIIASATGSQPRKDGGVTFEWFTRERFIPMREGNWRPATKRGNLHDINRYILPGLGAMPLKDLDKFHVASLLNRLAKKYSEPVVPEYA